MSKVLILGATGRLGNACVQAFARAGWEVHAQSRSPALADWPAGVIHHACAPGDLHSPPAKLDCLVQAANPDYTGWGTQALPLVQTAISLAEQSGALLLFPGNVYNFGPGLPASLSESTPFDRRANSRKGRIRVEIEDLLAGAAQAGRIRASILRAGDFFGSGKGSWFDLALIKDLIRKPAKPGVVYPGKTDQIHAWAYLPDLARAFVALGNHSRQLPAFSTHHFEGHNLTGQAFFEGLQQACLEINKRGETPLLPERLVLKGMPWPLLKLIGLFNPTLREVLEMRYLWDQPHQMRSESPLREALHQSPTPFVQAIVQSLRDARK